MTARDAAARTLEAPGCRHRRGAWEQADALGARREGWATRWCSMSWGWCWGWRRAALYYARACSRPPHRPLPLVAMCRAEDPRTTADAPLLGFDTSAASIALEHTNSCLVLLSTSPIARNLRPCCVTSLINYVNCVVLYLKCRRFRYRKRSPSNLKEACTEMLCITKYTYSTCCAAAGVFYGGRGLGSSV